jgi:branched-chain amino acid transport system substrate-binding protein
MGKRRALVILSLCLASMSNVSCKKKVSTQDLRNSSDTIVIGEVDAMTGSEATFGTDTYRGIMLAIQEVNNQGGVQGHKVRLIPSDAQGRPDESARAISKLITQDRVLAILTGATSSNALAMAPIAQQTKVPMVATAATNPKLTELGDYIFRICFIDPFQGELMAKFTRNHLNLKRVAILRDMKSDYSIGLADVYSSVFKKSGGEVVVDQSYSGGDIDFKSQLTAIRTKTPEAIFVPGYYTDVSLIARQAKALGMKVPLLGGDGWDSPKLKEIGGDALQGSYFSNFYSSDSPSEKVKNFLQEYKKAYGVEPNGSAATGYEAAYFLIEALKKSKSFDPKEIRSILASTQDFESLNGKMSIDSKRNAIKSAVVLRISEDGTPKYFTTITPH